MNTHLLRKCLEELKKDSPKIEYVCGLLEAMIEFEAPKQEVSTEHVKMVLGQTSVPKASFSSTAAGVPVHNSLDEIKRAAGEI